MTQNVELKNVKRKKKIASLEKKKARAGWIFVLPFVIGLVLVYIPIIYESLYTSVMFREMNPETRDWTYTFAGWESYFKAFTATLDGSDFLEVLIKGLQDAEEEVIS